MKWLKDRLRSLFTPRVVSAALTALSATITVVLTCLLYEVARSVWTEWSAQGYFPVYLVGYEFTISVFALKLLAASLALACGKYLSDKFFARVGLADVTGRWFSNTMRVLRVPAMLGAGAFAVLHYFGHSLALPVFDTSTALALIAAVVLWSFPERDWLKNSLQAPKVVSTFWTAVRLVFVGIVSYLGFQFAQAAWQEFHTQGSIPIQIYGEYGFNLSIFLLKVHAVGALLVFYKYLADTIFGNFRFKKAIDRWTRNVIRFTWAPLTIGAICFLMYLLHQAVYMPVSHYVDDFALAFGNWLNGGGSLPPGFGWVIVGLATINSAMVCVFLQNKAILLPVLDKKKLPTVGTWTFTANTVTLAIVALAALDVPLILTAASTAFHDAAANVIYSLFTGNVSAMPWGWIGYAAAFGMLVSAVVLLCWFVRNWNCEVPLTVPYLKGFTWKKCGRISYPSFFTLTPLSVGIFARNSRRIFNLLLAVGLGSLVLALSHLTGLVDLAWHYQVVPYWPSTPAAPIFIEGVISAVLIGWPLALYVRNAVLRQPSGANYAVWFVKLAKPHWVGKTPSHWLTWFYFLIIVGNTWFVVQLNSSLQDSLIALKTALQAKNEPQYWFSYYDALYVFLFAIAYMPWVAWVRAKAFMHWRQDLTKYVVNLYLSVERKYFSITGRDDIDNIDERIHEDLQEFTERTYGIVLTAADAILTLLVFTGKLWGISPVLGMVSIAYATIGSLGMFMFTNKMVALMNDKKRLEANFRYYLIFIRFMAESIAFFRGEKRELSEVNKRFDRIIENYNSLIAWTRRQGYLVKAYSYLDYFVVLLVMAPLWFAGKIEYGLIDGAQMAFGMVLGSLSLFVTEFVTLSRLFVTTGRAGRVVDVLEQPAYDPNLPRYNVVVEPEGSRILLDKVTIHTPQHPRLLIKDLSLEISPDCSVIFVGPSGSGKTSTFRAISDNWPNGTGNITRPPLERFMFLPQRPYMGVGTLRDQVLYPSAENLGVHGEQLQALLDSRREMITDEQIRDYLTECGLPRDFIDRYPNKLDELMEYRSWGDRLSPGEQQRLSFARVLVTKPSIVFADEATAAVDPANERRLYKKLKNMGVTYASVGHRPGLVHFHDKVCELAGDNTGAWRILTPAEYEAKQKEEADKED